MTEALPSLTPLQLLRLLEKDGWTIKRNRTREGAFVEKRFPDGGYRSTIVSTKHRRAIAGGTLHAILGPRQTAIGREGLRALIERHGLR